MNSLFKLLFSCVLALASCAMNDNSKERSNVAHLLSKVEDAPPPVPPGETDTLTVDAKAAVFYQPDSLQIEARMKEVGEEDFRAGMDDYLYYLNQSWQYLEGQGLMLLDAKGKKFIKFVTTHNSIQLVRLDTVPELWGVYLFDPAKGSYHADMTTMEEEYKNYYK